MATVAVRLALKELLAAWCWHFRVDGEQTDIDACYALLLAAFGKGEAESWRLGHGALNRVATNQLEASLAEMITRVDSITIQVLFNPLDWSVPEV